MVELVFSLAAALNIVWGAVADQEFSTFRQRLRGRQRAKRVAELAAERVALNPGTATRLDVEQLTKVIDRSASSAGSEAASETRFERSTLSSTNSSVLTTHSARMSVTR